MTDTKRERQRDVAKRLHILSLANYTSHLAGAASPEAEGHDTILELIDEIDGPATGWRALCNERDAEILALRERERNGMRQVAELEDENAALRSRLDTSTRSQIRNGARLIELEAAVTAIYDMTNKVENWDRENILAEINTIALGAMQKSAPVVEGRGPYRGEKYGECVECGATPPNHEDGCLFEPEAHESQWPACMAPDGAEPCKAYQRLEAENRTLRNLGITQQEKIEALTAVQGRGAVCFECGAALGECHSVGCSTLDNTAANTRVGATQAVAVERQGPRTISDCFPTLEQAAENIKSLGKALRDSE